MRTFTTSAPRRVGLLAVPAAALAAGAVLAACGGSSPAAAPGSSSPGRAASAKPAARAVSAPVDDIATQIQTGKQDGTADWPRFYPADLTVHHGDTVRLTITSYDDGPAPLAGSLAVYDKVQGGTETVDGVPATAVDNSQISHTLTVPGLGLNAAIPAVPSGRETTTVVYTFTAGAPGTYEIKCFAPCGDGPDNMAGPMAAKDWMIGSLTVS